MDPHVILVSFSDKIGGDSLSIELDPALFVNENFLSEQILPLEFKGGNALTKEFIDSLFTYQDQLRNKITDLISTVIKPVAYETTRQNDPSERSLNFIYSSPVEPSSHLTGKTTSNYLPRTLGGAYEYIHLLLICVNVKVIGREILMYLWCLQLSAMVISIRFRNFYRLFPNHPMDLAALSDPIIQFSVIRFSSCYKLNDEICFRCRRSTYEYWTSSPWFASA